MNMLQFHEPRTTTRLVYQSAIDRAVSEALKNDLIVSLTWYEQKWAAQDKETKRIQDDERVAQQTKKEDMSAVEKYGVDSPEAQEMREKRATDRAAQKEGKQEARQIATEQTQEVTEKDKK